MISWSKTPFLRILIPLLIGVVLGLFTDTYRNIVLLLVIALTCFLTSLIIPRKFHIRYLRGLFLMLSILFVGLVIINLSKQNWMADYYKNNLKKTDILIIKIIEPLVEKRQSYKTIGEVVYIESDQKLRSVKGKIVMYFQKATKSKTLNYGSWVAIKNNILELKEAPNPYEFSPKTYLGYRAIYESCYLRADEWKQIKKDNRFDVHHYCYKAREYCLKVFKDNGLSGDEFAVASAMIVGFEDELKPEIISYFSASGAMHLLSVSGLHIAFVYIILSFMLKPLVRIRNGKLLGFVFCVFVLWFYAIVTGFSAPVVRSAIMFSMVVYAKSFDKYLNMFNVLGLAAFFILVFDPLAIADVGFQLSFLALLSILVVQPIISELYFSRQWIIQKIWEITSVSISATIGTLPLTFYYFHQFPNYFLLVNLIVIPLSTLLLYTGFAIIIFSWLPIVPYVLTQGLKYITMTLNYILKLDESLPGSVSTGIQFNEIETIILFTAIIFLCIYLYTKNKKLILLSGISMLCFLVVGMYYYLPHLSQKKLTIYSIKKHLAIDYFDGNKAYFIGDSIIRNNLIDLRYHVFPNRIKNYIHETLNFDLGSNFESKNYIINNGIVRFNSNTLYIESNDLKAVKYSHKIKVNYLLLANNFNGSLSEINDNFIYDKLLLDASLTPRKRQKLIYELNSKHIQFWDILKDGAFVIDLQ